MVRAAARVAGGLAIYFAAFLVLIALEFLRPAAGAERPLCLLPATMHEALQKSEHEFAFAKWVSWDLTLRYYVGPAGPTTIGEWPDGGWCVHHTRSDALRARLVEAGAWRLPPPPRAPGLTGKEG